ncbi:hypothetical protein J7L70_05495, partial [Candidatus Bathyarchaeota archaeon]|nr:hypothetical protein [Candidatus Bathyarchaeota archaeon]
DETTEVRYKDFLFKIVDRYKYDLLKSAVGEILKKREKEEKIKKEIKLIISAIKPSLFEILKSRLWYSMYVNYANKMIYVDAVYNLPYEVVKVKDPIEVYEFLKKSIYENVTKFMKILESISQESRDKILDILEEAVSKQDSLLDSHDYGKFSDIMDDIKSFVDDSINKLVEQISIRSGFSHRQKQKSIEETYSGAPAEKTEENTDM